MTIIRTRIYEILSKYMRMKERQITAHQCCINKVGAFEDIVNYFINFKKSLKDTNVKIHSELVRPVNCIHSLFNELLRVWCGQRVHFLDHIASFHKQPCSWWRLVYQEIKLYNSHLFDSSFFFDNSDPFHLCWNVCVVVEVVLEVHRRVIELDNCCGSLMLYIPKPHISFNEGRRAIGLEG